MSISQTSNVFSTPNNTVGNLNGFFKEVYASSLKDLIPDGVKLLNMIDFVSKDKMGGNLYHQPVILGLEHGVTFAASDDDAFNLNPSVSGQIKDAQVRGNPLVLSSVMGYAAASRAQGGKNAFQDATKYLVSNMLRSVTKKLEIELLYGQMGYGTVSGSPSGATLTVATAEWAPGIWAGAEKMPVEIRSADGATSRGEYVISSVDMDARTLTMTSSLVGVIDTDIIWHKGAYGNEFAGIHKILTNTGTLFNISASAYNLWKGNTYSAGSAALSFTKLNLAVARAVEKGLDTKVIALVNPRAWANMLSDQAALRKYDGSYSKVKLENGSTALQFYSQNGDIEIHPSIYVKEGYAYLLCLEDWMRVGSQDVSFNTPGRGDEFFRHLESAAGYELRLYTDQAVFSSAPGKNVLISSIVNQT
jgi:hypothetical protein